jgi:hypothetical protein
MRKGEKAASLPYPFTGHLVKTRDMKEREREREKKKIEREKEREGEKA